VQPSVSQELRATDAKNATAIARFKGKKTMRKFNETNLKELRQFV
jgi:hypothetical protein